MFGELERIGERFGVRHNEIPDFITAVVDVMHRYTAAERVEDYHGKTVNQKGLT